MNEAAEKRLQEATSSARYRFESLQKDLAEAAKDLAESTAGYYKRVQENLAEGGDGSSGYYYMAEHLQSKQRRLTEAFQKTEAAAKTLAALEFIEKGPQY